MGCVTKAFIRNPKKKFSLTHPQLGAKGIKNTLPLAASNQPKKLVCKLVPMATTEKHQSKSCPPSRSTNAKILIKEKPRFQPLRGKLGVRNSLPAKPSTVGNSAT